MPRGHNSRMRECLRRLALALAIGVAACGDATFIVSFNSGVILGPPRCQGSGGDFHMQTQEGLTLLVVITSDTSIFVAGSSATCADLFANASVQVSGRDDEDRFVASSITVE